MVFEIDFAETVLNNIFFNVAKAYISKNVYFFKSKDHYEKK